MKYQALFVSLFIALLGCESTPEGPDTSAVIPELSVLDARGFEGENAKIIFDVSLSQTTEVDISFSYTIDGITAEPGKDFVQGSGDITVAAGVRSASVEVELINDELNEVEEKLQITLSNPQKATLKDANAIGLIEDEDPVVATDPAGYITAGSHYGYELVWGEEFESGTLDTDAFSYDIGDGCPNLCGWGNEELQLYTDDTENVFIENGSLFLKATEVNGGGYNSGRLLTKDKKEFRFGRIDVRAKLPIGQGLWPAIWMLGKNIDEVSWPACGEIDIVELVGHEANIAHGTAHWGPLGATSSTSKTSTYSISGEDFSDNFHVFSLVWEINEMTWYVDETKYFSLTPDDMQGQEYRFNQEFYLLLNVAVGGLWPGSPDATTVFPQQMEIDYIRVFQ